MVLVLRVEVPQKYQYFWLKRPLSAQFKSMFTQTESTVTITISRTTYNSLLILLGMAVAQIDDREAQLDAMRIVDEINEGNPNWIPYTSQHGKKSQH